MSARTTAEIVADLRDPAFVAMAHLAAIGLAREAADRLESLVARVAEQSAKLKVWRDIDADWEAKVAALDDRLAALHACDTPDCPAITYRCAEQRP